jgi:AcrR family transcriptional regulator
VEKLPAEKVDPRVRRTRQMLQQAMWELMMERGFVNISVHDITDRADLNRATFYKHFTDKYDLLNSIVRERFNAMLSSAIPADPHLTLETLDTLIETAYSYLASFHSSCMRGPQYYEQTMMSQQVQTQIYETLLAWLQKCVPTPTVTRKSPEITALLTSWTIFGPIIQKTCGTPKLPKQELLDNVKSLAYLMLEDYLAAERATLPSA